MFCTKCGNEVDDGAKFCGKCGARLDGMETESRYGSGNVKNTNRDTQRTGAGETYYAGQRKRTKRAAAGAKMSPVLIVAIAAGVFAAVYIALMFVFGTKNADSDAAGGISGNAEESYLSAYQEAATGYISEYGEFKRTQSGTVLYNSRTDTESGLNWFDPSGVISTMIYDFDDDNADELLVCYADVCEDGCIDDSGWNASEKDIDYYHIVMDIYEYEDGNAVQADSMIMGPYYAPDGDYSGVGNGPVIGVFGFTHICGEFTEQGSISADIAEGSDRHYIVLKSTWSGSFLTFSSHNAWILKYDGADLSYAGSYTQVGGGSNEHAYTGYIFNDDGVDEQLYVAEFPENFSEAPLYDDFDEAEEAFFSEFGIEIVRDETDFTISESNNDTSIFSLTNKGESGYEEGVTEYPIIFTATLKSQMLDDLIGNSNEGESTSDAGDVSAAGESSGYSDADIAEIENEIENIKSELEQYDITSFEEYIVSEYSDKIKTDIDNSDYSSLAGDYEVLKSWADRFTKSQSSATSITDYVQADVSEDNEVKLYISVPDTTGYNFLLEDFEVWEQNGNIWEQCKAKDISQINGMLTMDLVADVSSSMEDEFYTMQTALENFTNETSDETSLGLSTIGTIYERHLDFTSDKSAIIDAIWNLDCYGRTSLYQSLYSSVVYTASSQGARCVVAFTDGINEPYGTGYDYDAQDVIDASNYYQVPVYILGIGTAVESSELRYITECTGGEYYDNVSVSDLQQLYETVYENYGRRYQLTYETSAANDENREVYVLYADDSQELCVRFESEVKAEVLQAAYNSTAYSSDDLTSFYSDTRYLSSDELGRLGNDLDAVQTIINIYYAKCGYQFSDTDNGRTQLDKMISLGVITQNGTKDGDEVQKILKENSILWQNFSALYNFRYELIFTQAREIYSSNPGITKNELRVSVHEYFGESYDRRYSHDIEKAWSALTGE